MIPLLRLAQIDSTQAFLARHPELGRCAILADAQTAGRGRGDNAWISEAGAGLWMSARLPAPKLAPGVVLQRAMAAVAAALAPCGLQLGLKWPNDLVARSSGLLVKLGGIIGEAAKGEMLLGLGVNLRAAPEIPGRAIPPACLAGLGAAGLPEAPALALDILARWEDLAQAPEPAFRWPQEGDAISWEEGQGVTLSWEADGRLRVATARGVQRLSVGDVRGLGMH